MNIFFDEKKEENVEYKEEKINHFDVMKKIKNNQKLSEKDKNTFDIFLFLTQLSNDMKFIKFANGLNTLKMSNENLKEYILEFAKFIVPKMGYIKFHKKEKKDKDLEYISKYFNVNLETAKRYKNFLSKKEIKEIIDLYKEF